MGETTTRHSSVVQVRVGAAFIDGDLVVPQRAAGLVVFAHGSGRSRFSRRNRMVAEVLQQDAFATLLLDLLTRAEEAVDLRTGEIPFRHRPAGPSRNRRIGLGRRRPASERAPDRLLWCQHRGRGDVVCRGGASRSRGRGHLAGRKGDLAGDALPHVQAPTLLIVGGADEPVIELNRAAMARMHAPVRLEIVPGATHLFVEPGTLEQVSQLALQWCREHATTTIER